MEILTKSGVLFLFFQMKMDQFLQAAKPAGLVLIL